MIATFLYKNPRILLLLIGTIVVAGLTSLTVMPRLEDPILGKRVAVISTVFPGADASQVEALVTIPIEELLTSVAEIKQVRSNCRTGISNIVVELKDEVDDVERVWTLLRSRITDVSGRLPESCFDPQLEVFPLKAYSAIIAIKSSSNPDDVSLSRRLAKQLRNQILEISGTGKVDVFGDPGEQLVAELDPATLASLNTSLAAIASQIRQENSKQPGGHLRNDGAATLVDIEKPDLPSNRIANVLVSHGSSGQSIALSQIANIEKRLLDPAGNLALVDGQRAIVLGAFANDDQQIDRWATGLESVIESFNLDYSEEAEAQILFSQQRHINQRMLTLVQNLGVGTAAVALVVLLLMGWRSMLVVGMALPLSALMVITGMRALSIPIHQMSVTGLIVALGLLIDNAIVIVEEVRTRIVNGESPQQSITGSVRHLGMPLFGSTLTTALAFLPIATLPGPSGEFVGSIAVSVILAICASFVLAMTLIPPVNALLNINPHQRGLVSYGIKIGVLQEIYERSLSWVFRFPLVGILLGIVLPIVGFAVARKLPQQFFPRSDRDQIQIEVERSARDSISAVRSSVDSIRKVVSENENVKRQHWFLGGSAPTFYYNVVPRRRGTAFYAQAIVDVGDGLATDDVVNDLQEAIDASVLDSRVIVRQLEQGPPFDAPIEVRVVGPDLATLQQIGSQLRLLLSQTPNVIHTRSDLEETIPKLTLDFDKVLTKKSGLTETQIAAQLYTTLESAPAGEIFDGNEELPIVVKLDFDGDSKLDLLSALQLTSPGRRPPPRGAGPPTGRPPTTSANPTVASLANFELKSDVGAVVRIDGRRANEVKAYIRAGVLPSTVLDDFRQRLANADFAMPAGYDLELGGETEQRSNAVNSLVANAIVLFALMLLTLVASFHSFRCAIIVSVVGGLSIGLGPLALSVFGFPFGFMSIVGTMGLVGVAINDSIVVLAAIRSNDSARYGDSESLVGVVSGCTRHIIATTLTTIVGFTPLILGGGKFWPPLAITIAGGVGGATFLALYFVPALYLLLHRKRELDNFETAQNVSPGHIQEA